MLTTPYWQNDAGVEALRPQPLPAYVDVLVVGGGYTGLSAAYETGIAGANTLVVEAGAIGAGCSGRNGGHVAHSIKPSLATLTARYGAHRAHAICLEGHHAMAYLRSLAQSGVDCDWRQNGCFFGAHTPRHFERLARATTDQPNGLEQRTSIVARGDQRSEIDTDFYHGGVVYHNDASVDPMRLLRGLLQRAQRVGVAVLDHCRVLAIRPSGSGYQVTTTRGVVRTDKVLLATNGYSGAASAWHRRRVIPIGSYQIATAPLGVERVRALIPRARNVVDSRRVVVYYRPSPDGERIIFGGRAALSEPDPRVCAPRLRSMLLRIFPQLHAAAISHVWAGWVAYTFDTLPHLGHAGGIYYCMGFCGQGVPLAPYFGHRIGQQMVGLGAGDTALDGLTFPSRPYYSGVPWFMAPSVLAYRTLDALGL